MPQDRTAPPKEPTDWRAELVKTDGGARFWAVFDENDEIVVQGLDEPTARLIAAAPQKAVLCEELADALGVGLALIEGTVEALPGLIEGDKATGVYVTVPEEMHAALAKAGRAPQ